MSSSPVLVRSSSPPEPLNPWSPTTTHPTQEEQQEDEEGWILTHFL